MKLFGTNGGKAQSWSVYLPREWASERMEFPVDHWQRLEDFNNACQALNSSAACVQNSAFEQVRQAGCT
jgi:hypothetical protein